VRSHLAKPSRISLVRSQERRALVIERKGRRQVYLVNSPFELRQAPQGFVPLGYVIRDVMNVLATRRWQDFVSGCRK